MRWKHLRAASLHLEDWVHVQSTGTQSVKRKVFASYHHRGAQAYYDQFSRTFGFTYDIVEDHSLDREVDSDTQILRKASQRRPFGDAIMPWPRTALRARA